MNNALKIFLGFIFISYAFSHEEAVKYEIANNHFNEFNATSGVSRVVSNTFRFNYLNDTKDRGKWNRNCLNKAIISNECIQSSETLIDSVLNQENLNFTRTNSLLAIQKAAIKGTCTNVMYEDGNDSKWLGYLGVNHECSAILIAPNWALTAAHCNISSNEENYTPIYFANYFKTKPQKVKNILSAPIFNEVEWQNSQKDNCCNKRQLASNIENTFVIDQFYFDGYKFTQVDKRKGRVKYDVLLLKLNKSLNVKHLELSTNYSDETNQFNTYSMGSPFGHPIEIPFNKYFPKSNICKIFTYPEAKNFLKTSEDAAICAGDSGGAVTTIKDGITYQVGIISHTCPLTTTLSDICALDNCKSKSNIIRYQKFTKRMVDEICKKMREDKAKDYNVEKEPNSIEYCNL
jgi:hypothetical protein